MTTFFREEFRFSYGRRYPVLLPDVPVTQHNIFLAGQALQPYRAAGVDLVSGDADFRTESILETVGEAGGGVHHHRTGIHLAQEAAGTAIILRDDGIGMLRPVNGNMLDCLIQPADYPYAQDRGEIFGMPILFCRFAHLPDNGTR